MDSVEVQSMTLHFLTFLSNQSPFSTYYPYCMVTFYPHFVPLTSAGSHLRVRHFSRVSDFPSCRRIIVKNGRYRRFLLCPLGVLLRKHRFTHALAYRHGDLHLPTPAPPPYTVINFLQVVHELFPVHWCSGWSSNDVVFVREQHSRKVHNSYTSYSRVSTVYPWV